MKSILILSLLLLSACGSPRVFKDPTTIVVSGPGGKEILLTKVDIEKLPLTTVRAKDRGDGEHEFEGVELRHILALAGVEFNDSLRGKTHASSYLVVRGSDNFQTLFALVELDLSFSKDTVLLAFRRDGMLLPEGDRAYRIVAPGEKRRSRWVRGVRKLEVRELE